jgi:hypothetical protein
MKILGTKFSGMFPIIATPKYDLSFLVLICAAVGYGNLSIENFILMDRM